MVNNVSFNGGYNAYPQSSKDIENVVKYTMGTSIIAQEEGPLDGMGMMLGIGGAIEAFKAGKWAYTNRKDFSGGLQKGKDLFNADLANKKALFGEGGWKKADTFKTLWNQHSAQAVLESIPAEDKLAHLNDATKAKYSEAKTLADAAKKAGSKESVAVADKALAEARAMAHGQAKPIGKGIGGFFSRIGRGFGKYTGISKVNGAVKGLATTSPMTAKLLKFGKGNGIFLAIAGAIELFTQVIPSFTQLGAAKGTKQLVKSTAKTAANVGGWVAGAAAGAAIGSVIPGAGTVIGGAIGAICGLAGGFLGSWATTKAAEAVVGKNELDIAKEEQAKQVAQQVSKDPQALQALLAEANNKIQQEGTSTPDSQVAFGSLSKLTANLPKQNAQQSTQNYTGANQNNVANLFASNNNGFGQQNNYMDEDFMAMNAGLIRA